MLTGELNGIFIAKCCGLVMFQCDAVGGLCAAWGAEPGARSSTLGMGQPPAELYLGFVSEQGDHCTPVGSLGVG